MTSTAATAATHASAADTRPPRRAACPATRPQTRPGRLPVTPAAPARGQSHGAPGPDHVPATSAERPATRTAADRERPALRAASATLTMGTPPCFSSKAGSRPGGELTSFPGKTTSNARRCPGWRCRNGTTHRRRHLHRPRPAHNTIDPAARATEASNRWLRKLASLPRTAAPTASPASRGVSVGDAELVGVAFAVGVDVVVDDDGDGVRVGAGEVGLGLEGCPVVEGLPAVAACGGLTST